MNKINRLQQLANINETKVGPKMDSMTINGITIGHNKFNIFKQYVYSYFKNSSQFIDGDQLETEIRTAKSYEDIKTAIDNYWGWEDEQTVWLLDNFIDAYHDLFETKVGPRPGPITINAIASNSVTFYPEDFDTWDQFKEFCDRLRNDEDFKYDMFFKNMEDRRIEWEVTDVTQRNRFM